MSLEIRRATATDTTVLAGLLAAQFDEHEIRFDAGELARAIDGVFAAPSRGLFLVATDAGGAALGVAYLSFIWSIEHGGQSAWLDELYVVPAQRGQGVGRRLLDAIIEAARSAGALALDLEVERSHARAEHLYARAGFRQHTRQRWVLAL